MTNTICGHGRDVLIWVLSVHVRERCLMAPCELSETEAQSASDAVHDPAKLAEMLAERGRELGLSCDTDFPATSCIEEEPTLVWQACEAGIVLSRGDNIRKFTMPQARAILLQWLRLPDGAREKAEKALRGET